MTIPNLSSSHRSGFCVHTSITEWQPIYFCSLFTHQASVSTLYPYSAAECHGSIPPDKIRQGLISGNRQQSFHCMGTNIYAVFPSSGLQRVPVYFCVFITSFFPTFYSFGLSAFLLFLETLCVLLALVYALFPISDMAG